MNWPDKKAVPGIYRRRLVGTFCWLDLLAQWNDEHALLAFCIDDGHFVCGVAFAGWPMTLDGDLLVT
jgi:hypothetical protein